MIFISGDPRIASSWQGGLPTETDVAVFDNTSAAFTATQADHWGGVRFNGYTQTFSRSAYNLTLGEEGFDAAAASTGTVNLGTATIMNYGKYDGRGLPVANFIVGNATWHQKGGASDKRVTWIDASNYRRDFASLVFDDGCFVDVAGFANTTRVAINGNTRLVNRLYMYMTMEAPGSLVIGPNATVSGPGYIEISRASLSTTAQTRWLIY